MPSLLYHEEDTFLHRLNPLTKLATALLLMLALTVIVTPVFSLYATAVTVAAIGILGRVPPGRLARLLLPVAALSLGVVWTTIAFYVPDPSSRSRPLWMIGGLVVTDQGVAYGLVVALRMLGFFSASLLFVLTTDPTDFVQALIQRLHLGYRIGYGAHAAYGFVPLLDSELATIRAAHRIRGVAGGGGPVERYRYVISLLVPLLAGAVRRAERVALAMDARGFGAYPSRTFYRRSTFGRADLAFAVGALVLIGGCLLVLALVGWLGRLVPPIFG
ncbi:MAG: energy-coupling factor transporter transmembrane protein EcfT [Chloroflexi bacterium]|nr:energy-coupling factor transporter transmembrane protein EcfT [Chloroflexota bacterium]